MNFIQSLTDADLIACFKDFEILSTGSSIGLGPDAPLRLVSAQTTLNHTSSLVDMTFTATAIMEELLKRRIDVNV